MRAAVRFLASALLALAASVIAGGPALAQIGGPIAGGGAVGTAKITGGTISGVAISGGSITGASITSISGAPYTVAKGTIPVLIAPTGTMANNGAVTMGTSLGITFTSAYVFFPAGAIAAGVPAASAAYYVQMSSPTVGTVFNNLLSANLDATGNPLVPASPTPFATTGPGAFTGITIETTLLTLALPGGAMGPYGQFGPRVYWAMNNNANNKQIHVQFGAASIYNANVTSSVAVDVTGRVSNIGTQNMQTIAYGGTSTAGAFTNTNNAGSVDTSAAVSVVISAAHGTATDWVGILNYEFLVNK